jgi:hypothetical protein
MPFFYLPSIQNRGGCTTWRPDGRALAGDPVLGDGRQNGEDGKGNRSPCSPGARATRRGDSSSSGGSRQWWLGWRCLEARGSREVRLYGAGCYGKPRRALCRRGKAVRGEENILLATGGGGGATRSIREESRLVGEVPSGIGGVGLWDVTRHAGELAVAVEEGGSNEVVR